MLSRASPYASGSAGLAAHHALLSLRTFRDNLRRRLRTWLQSSKDVSLRFNAYTYIYMHTYGAYNITVHVCGYFCLLRITYMYVCMYVCMSACMRVCMYYIYMHNTHTCREVAV